MRHNHLKLVWVNPNPPKKNFFDKIVDWFCKPREIAITLPLLPWQKSDEEKAEILKSVLTNAFGDYDYTTQGVNLFPAVRAELAVKEMIADGSLNHYYKKYRAYEKCLKRLDAM